MTQTLAAYSLLAIYSAGAVYALAFVASVLDLARRSSATLDAKAPRALVGAGVGGTGVAVGAPPAVPTATASGPRLSVAGKVGFSLTILGFVLHVAGVVLRGVAADRVPWANMFEFAITGTALMVAVYLGINVWRNVRYLNAYITGMVALLMMLAALNVYVDVIPTPPPLQSIWLVVHVFVASLGTGFFAVAAGLSITQLLQARREETGKGPQFLQRFPNSLSLESTAYWINVVGFALWTFTLIAGSIWAEFAWGRYWGWDTKEVWTFIIWVVFAGYIHARATRGWRGARSAWLAIIGFSAVLFNFTIVNLFFKGLHSYSGL